MLLQNKTWIKIISLLFSGLSLGAFRELYLQRGTLFSQLGKLSFSFWLVSGTVALIAGLFFFAAVATFLKPALVGVFFQSVKSNKSQHKPLRWFLVVAIALIPSAVLLFTPLGIAFSGPFIRALIWLLVSVTITTLLVDRQKKGLNAEILVFALLLTSAIHYLMIKIAAVTNYPFMLIWSEGNRFYDYSVILGSSRYNFPGKLSIPYGDPGRYILWGLPFAIRGTPIWLHRLWDALLWTAPYLILGLLLSRLGGLRSFERWILALWIVVFLAQGPVYPTLILVATVIVLLVRPGSWTTTFVGAALAGYYAGLSRFTWLPAAAAWTGFLLISDFILIKGEPILRVVQRLLPIAAAILVGLGASALANPTMLKTSTYTAGETTTFSQPLLWYRLFPNATYASGILVNLAVAVLPLVLLLIWLSGTKIWKLSFLHRLIYFSVCIVFLVGGLVASVKIGGGSNLHNLDLLLVSLAILAAIAVKEIHREEIRHVPFSVQVLLALTLILPGWKVISSGSPLRLPDADIVERALQSIHAKAIKAQNKGEVLFIDHRQLLAFEIIKGVRLVPDYEKKYLQDQAMAGNADFFEGFYRDLARHRFSLIITQPIFITEQSNTEDRFPEENNAWVKWVAKPLLCYYTPVETIPEVQLQFLTPRTNPQGCQ